MTALVFDGSFDGFLSVVHACYYEKLDPISIQPAEILTLMDEARYIETHQANAAQVYAAIKNKISPEVAYTVYVASLSPEEDRYTALLAYIRLGFKVGHMVGSHLQVEYVRRVRDLHRQAAGEAHLLFGFSRFVETASGVFYCQITPRNNVLPLVADHFTRRFMNQQWIIHDKAHNQAAVYDGKSYVIAQNPGDADVTLAAHEEETQDLWVAFWDALSIESRKNWKLQRQLLPIYFRKNMTEFTRQRPIKKPPGDIGRFIEG
ncbi:MAG: TIGR03915 family putative DNA repair protein [Defluviitaleaceae bacterium]|nr:TIGR03915 family putative DNA repair protein [Defluviitaleaceae bacterium]